MKLTQFRNVAAIAERGSLRAAARHLGLAQPALSRSVAELARELGASLFERRSKGMVATPLGQAFVRRATAILNDVRRARDEFEQLRDNATGLVTIGLSIAAHLWLLPKSLGPFRHRYPKIRLHIIEGFYPTLEQGLQDGSVDFYVGPDPGLALPAGLRKEVLLSESARFCAAPGILWQAQPRSSSCVMPSGSRPRSRPRRRTRSASYSSVSACRSRGWPCKASRRSRC
jgi:DNA-binding transcriptional LysR family regulator